MRNLLLTLLLASSARPAAADPLHEIEDGAWQHEASGWIFPRQVGVFTRVGAPYTDESGNDGTAHYEHVRENERTVVTVHIHSAESIAPTATLARAKATVESEYGAGSGLRRSEDSLPMKSNPPLEVTRVRYMVDGKVAAARTLLYVADTGPWVVMARASSPTLEDEAVMALDGFLREQSWDSLGLTPASCTGPSCDRIQNARERHTPSQQTINRP